MPSRATTTAVAHATTDNNSCCPLQQIGVSSPLHYNLEYISVMSGRPIWVATCLFFQIWSMLKGGGITAVSSLHMGFAQKDGDTMGHTGRRMHKWRT